mmetsp:Transcript_3361/g.12618  ORF Transcript_3361/g.12618 Transcript_3361/m.12618 type:complete len:146 (-) Transcript_3361:253-690(-)
MAAASQPLRLVVNFDCSLAFLQRLCRDMSVRGAQAARPVLMYHWTASDNHDKIEDSNFRIPKCAQDVKNANAYGAGVYLSTGCATTKQRFGAGAERGILCLVLPGRMYNNDTQGMQRTQQRGYDSAVFWRGTGYVVFNQDQVLPC